MKFFVLQVRHGVLHDGIQLFCQIGVDDRLLAPILRNQGARSFGGTLIRLLRRLSLDKGLAREHIIFPPTRAHVFHRMPFAQEIAADADLLQRIKAQRVLIDCKSL